MLVSLRSRVWLGPTAPLDLAFSLSGRLFFFFASPTVSAQFHMTERPFRFGRARGASVIRRRIYLALRSIFVKRLRPLPPASRPFLPPPPSPPPADVLASSGIVLTPGW